MIQVTVPINLVVMTEQEVAELKESKQVVIGSGDRVRSDKVEELKRILGDRYYEFFVKKKSLSI